MKITEENRLPLAFKAAAGVGLAGMAVAIGAQSDAGLFLSGVALVCGVAGFGGVKRFREYEEEQIAKGLKLEKPRTILM